MTRFKASVLGILTVTTIAIALLALIIWQNQPLSAQSLQNNSTYVVEKGDSLISVAKKLGISVEALAAANGLPINAALSWKQELIIPSVTSPNVIIQDTVSSIREVDPESSWHPVVAAYLRALFYVNLGPQINWQLIDQEYTTPVTDVGYDNQTVLQLLAPADSSNGLANVEAIRQAIADQDRQALYTASTRATSHMIRYYIDKAEASLAQPGVSMPYILEAQHFYRAFQNFIEQADPMAAQQLKRAWHDMTSAVDSASADLQKFATTRAVIEEYLHTNYEAGAFSAREQLLPLPETASKVDLAPWLPPGSILDDQDPLPRLRLNFEVRNFDESDIPLVAYGDMLFDSPQIFGEPARGLGVACSTCHNRSDINNRFFIPGVSHQPGAADVDGAFFNPFFNDQRSDSLDTPSLRGLRFTAPYGRDGRFESLREFARNVIVNEFGGSEPTPFMLDALVAYMFEFDWQPNSLLNKDGTLNENTSEAARRGELLFNTPFATMGGRACSSCHLPSSNFLDRQRHDIGSDHSSEPFALDGFFDTPTLLNSVYTAPYFHDGALATLGEVVKWFDESYTLGLSDTDQTDLTEYLIAVGSADTPYELFDENNTPFMLDWTELTTFCTTLGSKLIPQHDAYHAILLLDTVTPDLRATANELDDPSQSSLVMEVADKLDEVRAAIQAGNWEKSATLYHEYETMVEEYDILLQ